MALNFDKNKINNTGTAEVVSTPSVSPVPEESVSPKPNVDFEGQYYQPSESSSFSPSDAQSEAASESRARSAAANQDAVKRMAEIKAASEAAAKNEADDSEIVDANAAGNIDKVKAVVNDNSDESVSSVNKSATNHIQESKDVSGYAEILAKNDKTIYQKTSEILDEYIKNHPDEYSQYAKMDDKQKRTFRDNLMGKLFRQLAGKKDISQAERKTATRDLAILLTTVEAKGLSLKEISSDTAQMKNMIAEGDKQLYNYMLKQIDTSNPDKALNEIAELYLTFTDPDYLLLQGNAKKAYLQKKQGKLFNLIGIKDPSVIPETSKQNAANIMKSILQGLSDKNLTIKDLVDMPPKEQSQFLVDSLDNYVQDHPDVVDKLAPETKHAYQILKTRNSLLKELSDIERPTDQDLYSLLLKKEKDGTLTAEQKEMLGAYKLQAAFDKKYGKNTMDHEANMSSNVVKIMVSGMSYEAHLKHQLNGVTDKKEVQKIVTEYVSGMMNDADRVIQLEALRKVLMEKGYKPEEIMQMLPAEVQERLSVKVLSNSDVKQAALGTDVLASFNSNVVDETANKINEILPSVRDVEWVKFYGSNVETTKYDESLSTGINKLDVKTANEIFTYIANNATTDAKKSSMVEFSLTTTDDSERISAYTESYKTIKSPAVTEGMAAAAHNTTDSNNRAIIESGVDYAIQNNGYSSDEINNINTARETGQTSYERNSVSSDSSNTSASNSASNSGNTKPNNTTTNTASSPTANATATATANATSSTHAKVVVSPQSHQAINEMRDAIAQLNQNYSEQIKQKALDSLERIITHIHDDQQVRAQKQAEQKEALEKKEEIEKVLEEAQTQIEKGERVTVATEIVEKQIAKKFNIDEDTVRKLRNAAQEGDLSAIYSLLGSINSRAQEHFILHISRKSETALAGFIRSHSNDKELIKMLIRINPNLIRSIDSNILLNCGIEKSEIVKYADATQFKAMLADLTKVGDREQLKQFYDALGDDAQNIASVSEPPLGSDAWLMQRQQRMADASYSATSTVVGNSRFPDGQTRQKIRPQDVEYWLG